MSDDLVGRNYLVTGNKIAFGEVILSSPLLKD
jgi:hypothetical protein